VPHDRDRPERMPVSGLDEPCPVCDRPAGDHTLREWQSCLGEQTTDLPYEEIPQDAAAIASENMRQRFGLESDIVVADHVVVKSLTIDGSSGSLRLVFPAVLHEFQVGVPGRPPATAAKVLFAGDAQAVRGYGRLIRDSANGAVNAAERRTHG
jgi:hypothetical protein